MATFPDSGLNILGGGSDGAGLGGGFLLGLLLGRGALGGLGAGAEVAGARCATVEDLNSQTLGDIKASIPFNEAQVQLALAGAAASLNAQGTANTQAIQNSLTQAALANATANALIARDIAGVDTNVDRQSTAIQIAIAADGAKTRDLITANQIATLNQQLTVAQLENAENRSIQREMSNSHNVTTTINTNQQQQQLQTQRQDFMLNSLVNGFGQLARATNSSIVIGSTGINGSKAANPTNVLA